MARLLGITALKCVFFCHTLVYDDERGSTYAQFIKGVSKESEIWFYSK